MGLRLRRSSMHDPSQPEFVDVYGVPFQLLAMATGGKPMARFDPTETYVEFDLGTPHAGMGGVTQVRERAYENFRVPAAAVPRRRRPARAAQQAVAVPAGSPDRRGRLRLVPEGGKVDYAGGVDRCETCSLRYRTGIRERLSAALRPGEGPERFLPALNRVPDDRQRRGRQLEQPDRQVVSTLRRATCPRPSAAPGWSARCAAAWTSTRSSSRG
jgi:hypothetical protein